MKNIKSEHHQTKILIYTGGDNAGISSFSKAIEDLFSENLFEIELHSSVFKLFASAVCLKSFVIIINFRTLFLSLFFSNCIYVLHGFENHKNYSFLKRILISINNKVFWRKAKKIVAVSDLTYIVNDLNGITADCIIPNVARANFYFVPIHKEKKKQILYCGRISRSKNIDIIIESFLNTELTDYTLKIIGTGPSLDDYKEKYKHDRILFLGEVKNIEQLIEEYDCSEVFISLNDHEPFGITYLEALLRKCKVIMPTTAGIRNHIIANNVYAVSLPLSTHEVSEKLMTCIETHHVSTDHLVRDREIVRYKWKKCFEI